MSDPTRWRDDPSGQTPGTEMLLRGARRPQPPGSHDLQRLGAAVDVISRRPAGGPSLLRLSVAAVVAFSIVGGGTFVWALHARNVQRLAAAQRARRVAQQPAPNLEHIAAVVPVPAPAPTPTPRAVKRHLAEPRVVAPAPPPAEPASPNDMLAREVPLIDAGRSELATAPSRALAALETHRREFPRGQLAAEREFLAVQALVQMNRIADARKRAVELATRYPTSSYAARATRLIEDVEAQRGAAPAHDGSRGISPPGPQRNQRDGDRL